MANLLNQPGNSGWAPKEYRQTRLQELEELRKTLTIPNMSVVVVGNTGAGKSTCLNALLGETNVLPTNGKNVFICDHT
eukprot:4439978-Pyramimonas_sp.AAC.2